MTIVRYSYEIEYNIFMKIDFTKKQFKLGSFYNGSSLFNVIVLDINTIQLSNA